MKKIFFFAQLATAIACISLVSCQKENPTPDPTPEPQPGEAVFVCEHENLEYVDAVKRTSTTRGNIAHYHCNDCNCNFLDANCTIQIQNPYIKPSNMDIDTTILNKYKDLLPFIPANQTKAPSASIKAVFKLHQKVSSFKYQQTTKEALSQVMAELKDIKTQLALITVAVQNVQSKCEEILQLLKSAPYAEDIADILNDEKMVWNRSCSAFNVIDTLYSLYNQDKITEAQLKSEIYAVCKDWNDKAQNKYSLFTDAVSRNLITNFNGFTTKSLAYLKYPQLFHAYCDNYNFWDHEGYTDRTQWDLISEASLSMGYLMSCFYTEYVNTYDSDFMKRKDSTDFLNAFNKVDSLVQTDMNNMQLANKAYKRYHNSEYEVLIEPVATVVNSDIIDGHYNDYEFVFTVTGDAEKSKTPHGIDELNYCWNDLHTNGTGYRDGTTLTVEDYTEIRMSDNNKSIYKILYDAGISNVPADYLGRATAGGKPAYIRYYSTKLTYTSKTLAMSLNFVNLDCYEYHIYLTAGKLTTGGELPASVTYSCNAMKSDCTRSDYFTLLKNYSVGNATAISSTDYRIQGRTKDWEESGYSQVFLRKYTGEVYDK